MKLVGVDGRGTEVLDGKLEGAEKTVTGFAGVEDFVGDRWGRLAEGN